MILEPLGLLNGAAADAAIAAQIALPIAGCMGQSRAFTLVRRADDPASTAIPISAIPSAWRIFLAPLARPPAWAGFPDRPLIMGILNVTPDSFSNGGLYGDAGAAIEAALEMIDQGADIIDIGGESTRPGAETITADVEQARVMPVVDGLKQAGVPLSIDTRNAATMRATIEAGAHIVNDVSGLTHDPQSAATVAALGCPVIIMHMRGTPATMNELAFYNDAPTEIYQELTVLLNRAEQAGIMPDRIAIDPGLGFAKNCADNEAVLQRLPLFLGLHRRILIGASRKRFIGTLSGEDAARNRDPGSLAAHLFALGGGASIIRTHDVKNTAQALRVWNVLER